ncbi:carbonic anhydrase [Methyloversatilis sp. RAC08]|uniref:carbonic anhydrase n=1 Tax=Methyloversatilis sp. RAC08 TaxID=1842540 RepID=UPI001CBA7B33|nr:carbonic anhydrase [Methyloversatilis sp. RAC08]
MKFAAAGMAAGIGLSVPQAFAASGPTTSLTADEALAKLKAGNQKYLDEPQVCAAELKTQRSQVAKGQAPWATIVSCADSRVPPELLFGGVGVGELFVARNAGNMADTATMGTIEYGSGVLGVPLIVVLGHQRCGAVVAACEVVEKQTKFPASIGPMVQAIVPAAEAVAGKPGDFVDNAIHESAVRTAHKIATESPIIAELVKSGKVKVVAGRYNLDDGRVEFFS